jgi:hypothetical protein
MEKTKVDSFIDGEHYTYVVFTEPEANLVSTDEKKYLPNFLYCFPNEQANQFENQIQQNNTTNN